ncbi:MAG: helix-turn-helix domain-containing protein, partial [Bacteroidia bacterium]
KYLPQYSSSNVPSVINTQDSSAFTTNDRDLIFKVVRDMKGEIIELKKLVYDLMSASGKISPVIKEEVPFINRVYSGELENIGALQIHPGSQGNGNGHTIEVEETLSLQDKEIDMIRKALRKHKGKRKYAAKELGISERTLYRKINEYHIEE